MKMKKLYGKNDRLHNSDYKYRSNKAIRAKILTEQKLRQIAIKKSGQA